MGQFKRRAIATWAAGLLALTGISCVVAEAFHWGHGAHVQKLMSVAEKQQMINQIENSNLSDAEKRAYIKGTESMPTTN